MNMKWYLVLAVGVVAFGRAVEAGPDISTQEKKNVVALRVEASDTYINLFGNDWERVWKANKIYVRRGGQLITSPDVLISGSIITVTRDVHLTRRASARLSLAATRRTAAEQRLQVLRTKLSGRVEAALPIAELERLLSEPERFVAQEDAVDRTLVHLEALASFVTASTGELAKPGADIGFLWIGTPVFLAVLALAGIIVRRRTNRLPEARQRYAASLRAAEGAFTASR
jgi:hypothetical protein